MNRPMLRLPCVLAQTTRLSRNKAWTSSPRSSVTTQITSFTMVSPLLLQGSCSLCLLTHFSAKLDIAVATPSDSSLKGVNFKYVVATHKGIQTSPSAAEQLKPVIGKDTTIVLIQNGVGVEEPFKAMYPNNTILSGVVSHPADMYNGRRLIHLSLQDLGQC